VGICFGLNISYVGRPVRSNKREFRFFFIFTIDEFAAPHIEYANSICWLKGSYYLPTEESMFVIISFFLDENIYD
jgi:hypothetical protein